MKQGRWLIALFFSVLALTPEALAEQFLPPGARWLEHLNKELLPFWTTEAAYGKPIGTFPSLRCNDGALYNQRKPCPEIGPPRERYLVALSRQSYGYGVAFHLTGNRDYLDAMKAGIDFIRQNAMDRINGGMRTTQDVLTGSWGPRPELRNPQEMAYGLLGMAFYYYLTRDAEVLNDVIAVKNYIFEKFGASGGLIQWRPSGTPVSEKHLVAQLDQFNAYLVLLTPLLPESIQADWQESLLRLSKVMIEQFYSSSDKLFVVSANMSLPNDKVIASTGTDFGHNAKALWMVRWAGLIVGHRDLVDFAEDNARTLFARAYLENCGCWAAGVKPGGGLDLNQLWWIYAELDQLAGTLALRDSKFATYLPRAYEYWFDRFVDKQFGEVWESVDVTTHTPSRQRPKQWQWKNAYHSFEHALVGYIVAQQLQTQPITLYYAFAADKLPEIVQPYFYSGTIKAVEIQNDSQGRRSQKVTFSHVH